MPTRPLATEDLDHVLTHAHRALDDLRGARVFLTGGTGFFGHTLVESILHANRELSLDLRISLLTRSPEAFRAKSPHIANDPAITLLAGDITSFPFPAEPHTHIVHAATDSTGTQAAQTPFQLAASILDGTRRIIDFARHSGAQRLLYTSSGAVYGRSTTLPYTPETCRTASDPLAPASAYDEAKRMSETLLVTAAEHSSFEPVIARCFAFVGPHLPLDQHFAIGNFIGSVLTGQAIHISGDGTPRRSWLYTADLAIWLWTLLVRGRANQAYNVGSGEAYTIAQVADLVAATLHPGLPIHVARRPDPTAALNSYVPATDKAHNELGLEVRIRLPEAICRTAAWYRHNCA